MIRKVELFIYQHFFEDLLTEHRSTKWGYSDEFIHSFTHSLPPSFTCSFV